MKQALLKSILALLVFINNPASAIRKGDSEDIYNDSSPLTPKIPFRAPPPLIKKVEEGESSLTLTYSPRYIVAGTDFSLQGVSGVSNTIERESTGAIQVRTDKSSQQYQLTSTPISTRSISPSKICLLLEAELWVGGLGVGVLKASEMKWFLTKGYNALGLIKESLDVPIDDSGEDMFLIFTNYSRKPSISEFTLKKVSFRVTPTALKQSIVTPQPQPANMAALQQRRNIPAQKVRLQTQRKQRVLAKKVRIVQIRKTRAARRAVARQSLLIQRMRSRTSKRKALMMKRAFRRKVHHIQRVNRRRKIISPIVRRKENRRQLRSLR